MRNLGALVAFAFVLLPFSGALGQGDKNEQIQADLKTLSGEWVMTKMEVNGKLMDPEGKSIIIDAGKYYFVNNEKKSDAVRIYLDPTKKIKTIDMALTGEGANGTQLGIYRITRDGDAIEICFNSLTGKMKTTRPRSFSAGVALGAGDTYYSLERKPGSDKVVDAKPPKNDTGDKKLTKKEAIAADLKKLSGNWTLVKMTISNGNNFNVDGKGILFDGDKYYFVINGKKEDGGLFFGKAYLDPTKEPKTIDLVFTGGSVTGTKLGIYQFTEDGLELCFNEIRGKMASKRPQAFSAGAKVGAGETHMVLERAAGENVKEPGNDKKPADKKVNKKDAIKADLKALSGNWNMLKIEINGKPFGNPEGKGILFDGDMYHMVNNGKKTGTSAKIYLDPTKEPKTIDLVMTGGGINGTALGIYRITDDGLEICYNQIRGKMASKRPSAFSSGATVGAGDTYYVLEKGK